MSQVISSNRMIPWVPGKTLGVVPELSYTTVFGITNYPISIECTNPTYAVDPTGASDSSAGIMAAIAAAPYYTAIHLPAGTYNIAAGVTYNKDAVALRGDGPTNTVCIGHMIIGPDQSGPGVYGASYGIAISSGATKGSTNITFFSATDTNGTPIGPGDSFMVSSFITTDPNPNTNAQFQYITSAGGDYSASITHQLQQKIVILGTVGNTCTFTPPLIWDFTNTPIAIPENFIGNGPTRMRVGVGLENIGFQSTNATIVDNATFLVSASMLFDSWITNCWFINGNNYNLAIVNSCDCYLGHDRYSQSRSSGSDHAGVYTLQDGGLLVEDSIMSDGLQPGIEINNGVCGNAFFANFFTNNLLDINMHNTHMAGNLWEENKSMDFHPDGYYGSASHQVLFRCRVYGTVALNRWTTFFSLVGNVIGNTSHAFNYLPPQQSNYSTPPFAIFQIGWPNINNLTFDGTNGPIPYNFPGWQFQTFGGDLVPVMTNGYFVITNTQGPTNIITGNFTNLWAVKDMINMNRFYHLAGQDSVNTNFYWPIGTPSAFPTASNVTFSGNTTVTNGQRIFIMNQSTFQWLNTSNILTEILTGNSVCTNQSTFVPVWDANGVQTLTNSYLYASKPTYWGSDNWPAIGPDTVSTNGFIPAEQRYFGITNSGGGGGGLPGGSSTGTFMPAH